MWLGIFGGVLMVMLMIHRVKASILWGVLFVTFISWIPNQARGISEGVHDPQPAPCLACTPALDSALTAQTPERTLLVIAPA